MNLRPRARLRRPPAAVPARTAWTAWTVWTAALALLTGCSAPAPAAHPRSDDAAVRAVLAARAHAVLAHDRTAFLATVDPAATAFRTAQAQVFTGLERLPLSSFGYRLRSTGAFPVAGPGQVAADTELSYGLRGYDTAPVTARAYLTLRRSGGHWYVTSQTGGQAAGRHTDVQPWDLGTLTVVTGARSLVLGQGGAAALRGYAGLADRAVPVVDSVWPGAWAHRAIVEVPGTEAGLAALLDAPPAAYQDIAAVTTAELRGTGSAPADRVIVNPQAFAGLSALGRRVVLTHELTHVATRTATTSRTPLWLSEGFADYAGWTGTGTAAARIAPELRHDVTTGHAPELLPSDADFASTAAGLPQAYEGAWLACRLVAARWGQPKLVALYRAAGRSGPTAALHDELGLSVQQFTDQWRAYVKEQLT
ncbi:hypothetical protein [Streptantibioticus silvisoli]|uniref:Peptidase MA-like domain-containing protein n=1 Tax=Streptantibioticus silvisoli TaxID=2705255 RepID=A0ABT6VYI1_9ACTN|nr:hypothetical protein [Streptantibioticus silvisoli]MDI5963532.1 hypothetical protein [Streptantibioticus silvisoli]